MFLSEPYSLSCFSFMHRRKSLAKSVYIQYKGLLTPAPLPSYLVNIYVLTLRVKKYINSFLLERFNQVLCLSLYSSRTRCDSYNKMQFNDRVQDKKEQNLLYSGCPSDKQQK